MEIVLGSDGASLFALIDDDLLRIVKAAAREKDISMGNVAKELDVNRTYFYSMFDDKRVRVEYIIQLQNLLDLEIITDADINRGIGKITAYARKRYVLS
jgi:predicted transcriptional regulator